MAIVFDKLGTGFDREDEFGSMVQSLLPTARNLRVSEPFRTPANIIPVVFIDEERAAYSSVEQDDIPFTTPTEEDEQRWDDDYAAWIDFLNNDLDQVGANAKIAFYHVHTFTVVGFWPLPVIPMTDNRTNQFAGIAESLGILRNEAGASPNLEAMQDHFMSVLEIVQRRMRPGRPRIVSVLVVIDISGSMKFADIEPPITEFLEWLSTLDVGSLRLMINAVEVVLWGTERWLQFILAEIIRLRQT